MGQIKRPSVDDFWVVRNTHSCLPGYAEVGLKAMVRTQSLCAQPETEREHPGAIFLHKHPSHKDAVTLFLRASDETGMENVLRLFPVRTGVFGPDWMVISSEVATLGAAGVTGAG